MLILCSRVRLIPWQRLRSIHSGSSHYLIVYGQEYTYRIHLTGLSLS
jgi:hypothetical protein